jgi:hypothetical protein
MRQPEVCLEMLPRKGSSTAVAEVLGYRLECKGSLRQARATASPTLAGHRSASNVSWMPLIGAIALSTDIWRVLAAAKAPTSSILWGVLVSVTIASAWSTECKIVA